MTTYALEQGGRAHEIWRGLSSRAKLPKLHPDFMARIYVAPSAVEEDWPFDAGSGTFSAPPAPPAPPKPSEIAAANLAAKPALRALVLALIDPAIDLSGMDEATAIATIAENLENF